MSEVVASILPKLDVQSISADEMKQILPMGIEPVNDVLSSPQKIVAPFSAYEQLKGTPYTVQKYEIKDYPFLKQEPKLDIKGMLEKVNLIESFIKSQIKKFKLKDEVASYEQLIKEIEDEIKITPQERVDSKFKRTHNYIKALLKQQEKLNG